MKRDGSYRDETASLVAENSRLRGELSRARTPRRRAAIAAALIAVDAVTALLLRPWFNGASDARFWGATIAVATIALVAIGCAMGAVPPRG